MRDLLTTLEPVCFQAFRKSQGGFDAVRLSGWLSSSLSGWVLNDFKGLRGVVRLSGITTGSHTCMCIHAWLQLDKVDRWTTLLFSFFIKEIEGKRLSTCLSVFRIPAGQAGGVNKKSEVYAA